MQVAKGWALGLLAKGRALCRAWPVCVGFCVSAKGKKKSLCEQQVFC